MTIVLTYDILIRRWRYAGVAQLVEQLICNQQVQYGRVPERPKGTDCKSVAIQLRWFESTLFHQIKTNHFCDWFLFLYKQSGFGPLMGANAEACEARSDRETVRWTVSTLVQRCEAPAIKSTLFHHVVTSYISLVAIFFIFFLKITTALIPLLLLSRIK